MDGRVERLWRVLADEWLPILVVVALFAHLVSAGRVFLPPGLPALSTDAAFLEHAGWSVTQGSVPYADFIDPKPPLVFEFLAVLAVLTGGHMLAYHVLVISTTIAVSVGSLVLLGLLTEEMTGNRTAALVAGVVPLAYPPFHILPAQGIRVKFFTLFFGLLAVYLLRRDRPLASGATAAIAAGFWQFGIVFPVLVLGATVAHALGVTDATVDSDPWRPVEYVVLGGGSVALATVIPIVLSGAAGPMIAEVVVANVYSSESIRPIFRLYRGFIMLGYSSLLILSGIAGLLLATYRRRIDAWVLVGSAWFGIQIFILDFDGPPDLLAGVAFVALGTGLLYDDLRPRRPEVFVGPVLCFLLVSVAFAGSLGLFFPTMTDISSPVDPQTPLRSALHSEVDLGGTDQQDDPSLGSDGFVIEHNGTVLEFESANEMLQYIFWNRIIPETCDYRQQPQDHERAWRAMSGFISQQHYENCPDMRP